MNRKLLFIVSNLSSHVAFGIIMICNLVTIGMGVRYFGASIYGMWIIVSTVLAYFQITDFGIGLTVMNDIAKADSDYNKLVILKRSFFLLAGISFFVFLILLVVNFSFSNWIVLLGNIPRAYQQELKVTLIITILLFLIRIPTTVFSVAFTGIQQMYWSKFYNAITAILSCVSMFMTMYLRADFIFLAFFMGVTTLVVGIVSGLHFFLLHPQLNFFKKSPIVGFVGYISVFKRGMGFFLLQIFTIVLLNTPNIIISNFLNTEKVTVYSTNFKLYYTGLLLVASIGSTLWPMYAKAMGNKDWKWVNDIYNDATAISIIGGGLIWLFGLYYFKYIIEIWLGGQIYGGELLIFIMGAYVYLASYVGSSISLLNAMSPSKIQIAVFIWDPLLNIVFSIILVKILGVAGVAFGLFLSTLITYSIFPVLHIKKRSHGKVTLNTAFVWDHAIKCLLPLVLVSLLIKYYVNNIVASSILGFIVILIYIIISCYFSLPIVRKYLKINPCFSFNILKWKGIHI